MNTYLIESLGNCHFHNGTFTSPAKNLKSIAKRAVKEFNLENGSCFKVSRLYCGGFVTYRILFFFYINLNGKICL